MNQAPLRPAPRLLAKPWGGRSLGECLGISAPPGTGEAWLASDLPGEAATEVKGVPLRRLIDAPIPLVKVLDSTRELSVQVHPDDALARRLHGPAHRGKWETWYFLRAPSQGFVFHGLADDASAEDLLATVRAGRNPEDLLRKVHVCAGQSLAVPPGTVHALTAGAVVVEVQTPSDHTYRLYDWGRVGDDGHPRALHLDEAAQALELAAPGREARDPDPRDGSPGRLALETTGPLGFELIRAAEGPVRLLQDVTRHALALVGIRDQVEVRSRAGAWAPEVLKAGDCMVVAPGAGELMLGGQGEALLGWLEA